MSSVTAYKGIVIHSISFGTLEILNPGLIGVNSRGTIVYVHDLATTSIDEIAYDKVHVTRDTAVHKNLERRT
jgi:hypothetical protein